MSSYYIRCKDKETGEEVRVAAIDDYFGSHIYGYIPKYEFGEDFSKTVRALTQEEFNKRYKRITKD